LDSKQTPFVQFRALIRRRAPTVLCAAACVLLALVLVLGGLYFAFQDIALRSISLRDNEFSSQTDALSGLMEEMIRNYGMQAFYAPEVTELRESGSITALERVRDLRELGTYVSSSDFVESITVYNQASNTIYSTDSDVLSDTADRFIDQSAARLFCNLNTAMRMTPLRRTAFPGQGTKETEYFSFLFFETNSEDEPLGNAMMLNIAYDWFVGNLLSFDDRGSCVLLDRRGELIYAPSDNLSRQADFFRGEASFEEASFEEAGYLLRRYDGVQLVCHFSQLESNGWYCLRILPLSECLPGLLQLRNGLAACLTLAVMLLVIACTATLVFLYVPFHKIRLALQRVGDYADQPEAQITSLVRDSLHYQQSHLLIDLLEGRPVPLERIPEPPLTLLVMECAHPAPARAMILTTCPAALLRHEDGNEVALIPGLPESDVIELCGALAAHAHCRCYRSVPLTGTALLPTSYATLRELQHLRFWYPGQQLLSEAHFAPRTTHSSLSEKQLAALISTLRNGELEEGRALWQALLTDIRGDSFRDQRFAFNRVAHLLQELLSEQLQPTEPILSPEFWTDLEDVGALTARFDLFFCRICQCSIDHRRRRLSDIAAQVAHRI
ncbi:MAG: cache domain-containing protein, partial [Oscillospiraceae bacterium]